MAFFVVSALAMMLFRKNGVYAFAVMAAALLFYMNKARDGRKTGGNLYLRKTGMLLVIIFGAYFLINSSLTVILHAKNEENQEILTVPIQQLARTYKFNPEVFPRRTSGRCMRCSRRRRWCCIIRSCRIL